MALHRKSGERYAEENVLVPWGGLSGIEELETVEDALTPERCEAFCAPTDSESFSGDVTESAVGDVVGLARARRRSDTAFDCGLVSSVSSRVGL